MKEPLYTEVIVAWAYTAIFSDIMVLFNHRNSIACCNLQKVPALV